MTEQRATSATNQPTGPQSMVDAASDHFAAFQSGELQRMTPLVELLSPVLWHIARGCGLDQQSAQDVVQCAWMRLVEKSDQIQNPRTVLAWLSTTSRREAWRARKNQRRTDPRENDEILTSDGGIGDPADDVVFAEDQRLLWTHFRELSPRCQQLLRVICQGGPADYADLSSALNMPIGSIGPTRGRCLAALRTALLNDPDWSTS